MHGLCFLQAASFHVTALLIFVVALGLLRELGIGVVALSLPLTLRMWMSSGQGPLAWWVPVWAKKMECDAMWKNTTIANWGEKWLSIRLLSVKKS